MGQQKQNIITGAPEKTDKEKIVKKSKEKEKKSSKIEEKPKLKKQRSQQYLKQKDELKFRSTDSSLLAIKELQRVYKANINDSLEVHIALILKPKETLDIKEIKIDAQGVIHQKLGKITDSDKELSEKFNNLLNKIYKNKSAAKKDFIKSISICTTQSPSIKFIMVEK